MFLLKMQAAGPKITKIKIKISDVKKAISSELSLVV